MELQDRAYLSIMIILSKLLLELLGSPGYCILTNLFTSEVYKFMTLIQNYCDRLQRVTNGCNCDRLSFDIIPKVHSTGDNSL